MTQLQLGHTGITQSHLVSLNSQQDSCMPTSLHLATSTNFVSIPEQRHMRLHFTIKPADELHGEVFPSKRFIPHITEVLRKAAIDSGNILRPVAFMRP